MPDSVERMSAEYGYVPNRTSCLYRYGLLTSTHHFGGFSEDKNSTPSLKTKAALLLNFSVNQNPIERFILRIILFCSTAFFGVIYFPHKSALDLMSASDEFS